MIELYHSETCRFCVKVRNFLENEGIAYVSKPISFSNNSKIKEELLQLGGKTQVPFLVDPEKNVKMYESDDIVAYIKQNYTNAHS